MTATFAGAISASHIGSRVRATTPSGTVVQGVLTDLDHNPSGFIGQRKWSRKRRAAVPLIRFWFGDTSARLDYSSPVEVLE